MNTASWPQIKDLLDKLLELEPNNRRDFLNECGASAEVREEVESLIGLDAASRDFMSLGIDELAKDLLADEDVRVSSLVGQQLGIYEICDELGLGGMGAVYLAVRTDGKFDQKVAIKMLKREFNVGKLRQSFQREREILSRLNHPNIARLLDAGQTDDGVPYLVMEYVEGVPIDEFCRREKLPLKAILKLFNKVCDAVSFAHRNLVIHRDIKPSNILVTANGDAKLLDFGISKLVTGDNETSVTVIGAMTPEYASPEQVKGEPVSTASDIYSLGVVLYKLLTGALPLNLNGLKNGELLTAVKESEPLKPSVSATRRLASDKAGHIGQLVRSLRGDLDNIILKALSKEPDRRYFSIDQFSSDIWRYLDGLPVLARPATRSYRAGKFLRRHKIPAVAFALIFASLAGGLALAFWQARKAEAHARNSAIETEKAKEEQRKSEKVTKFVSKIFGYANPAWFAEGAKSQGKARVIDVVEELSGKIDAEFAAEPDVAAALHANFAAIFHWVSKSAPAEMRETYQQKRRFHALRGLELRKKFHGEYHELVAGDMFSTYGMVGSSDRDRAAYLMKAILMMRDLNPRSNNYAFMYEAYTARLIMPDLESIHEDFRREVVPPTDENKYQIAERMLREALEIWKLHYPPDHGVILTKNCWLAYTLAKQEKWTEFKEPYQICEQIPARAQTDESLKWLLPDFELAEKTLR